MKRKEFIETVCSMVDTYVENQGSFDDNPQLRVDPSTMLTRLVNGADMLLEIENSDERVEIAAAADGAEAEEATQDQVYRLPEFHRLRSLVETAPGGGIRTSRLAVEKLADTYPQLT